MSKECIWCHKEADHHFIGMPREGDREKFIEWYSCHKCMPAFYRNTNTNQGLWYSSMVGWVSHTTTLCDIPQCNLSYL
jgi:hypothetical protein